MDSTTVYVKKQIFRTLCNIYHDGRKGKYIKRAVNPVVATRSILEYCEHNNITTNITTPTRAQLLPMKIIIYEIHDNVNNMTYITTRRPGRPSK